MLFWFSAPLFFLFLETGSQLRTESFCDVKQLSYIVKYKTEIGVVVDWGEVCVLPAACCVRGGGCPVALSGGSPSLHLLLCLEERCFDKVLLMYQYGREMTVLFCFILFSIFSDKS